MAISKEQLAAIISGRAKELCNSEFDRMVESKTSRGKLNNPSPSDYDDDAGMYDSMYINEEEEIPETTARDFKYNANGASNSRMPENIKQSMLNERIDVSSLGMGASVLDGLGVKPTPKKTTKKAPMREQTSVPQSISAPIDYSIIKAIVNECLNEYFSKQQLNESATLKTIGLSGGNISLVDNKGNVYKAKLEKIGNKNDL